MKEAIKSDSSEEDDDDDDEGEWVIKADSGSYDYSQPVAKEPSKVEEPEPVEVERKQVSISELNELKSKILRAQLLKDTATAEKLQQEYDSLVGTSASGPAKESASKGAQTLDSAEIRQLQEKSKTSQDMTVAEMVREEKLTSAGGQGAGTELDMARQIGKDRGYEQDSDYVFDNADKLSKSHVLSADDARKRVLERTRHLNTITDECSLCIMDQDASHSKVQPISIGSRVYLAEAAEPALTKGVSVIVPLEHRKNTLECDDDEWEEIRNFMKCLTKMWAGYNRQVLFYENAVTIGNGDRMHACIYAVPVKAEAMESAPVIFREAMETSDEEWAVHRKVINTLKIASESSGEGARFAFRTSIAKEAPYFHVWFNINGGLGHIVEDREQWPKGDLFAREIIGNMIRTDIMVIRKRTRWPKGKPKFVSKWPQYDWTADLN